MAATLTALMDISEAETGTMALRLEALGVLALLRETAELYEVTAEDKGIALTIDAPSDLQVRGDRARLRQALANLTDNAVKYTPRRAATCGSAPVARGTMWCSRPPTTVRESHPRTCPTSSTGCTGRTGADPRGASVSASPSCGPSPGPTAARRP